MIQGFQDQYRWLSNFWYARIGLQHNAFNLHFIAPTNEHAYQAMKCKYYHDFEHILNMDKPAKTKYAGKRVTLVSDWEDTKLDIMYQINLAKYTQHPDLLHKLRATGTQHIEETNAWGDQFWDVCNGVGQNHLGKILMRIREELC